ncbi:16S rRNA (uracil(1498)-N(3))-methyltransferase [Thalassotalea euphylliae]|uniref:16S rRNA (uracil(1498)-N(3))-methyltransferase n=1 Tax=Thalassotalea euphylliae TaxID=1655234 RepID=UPI0036376AA8
MRNPRIYLDSPLTANTQVQLSDDAFGHVVRVLRLNQGDAITLFNGSGSDFQATLTEVSKKKAFAQVNSEEQIENESPLRIHLGQGISRGDRMDFTLQKSVELGVSTITPLFTERCGVKLSGERLAKKHEQWQKIVISACEQSGRSIVPEVKAPISLEEWLSQQTNALKLNLHPRAEHSIMTLPVESTNVRLLIGPEGGLSDKEIEAASEAAFTGVLLGPRVLRTETAALTAITALQCRFGDL